MVILWCGAAIRVSISEYSVQGCILLQLVAVGCLDWQWTRKQEGKYWGHTCNHLVHNLALVPRFIKWDDRVLAFGDRMQCCQWYRAAVRKVSTSQLLQTVRERSITRWVRDRKDRLRHIGGSSHGYSPCSTSAVDTVSSDITQTPEAWALQVLI